MMNIIYSTESRLNILLTINHGIILKDVINLYSHNNERELFCLRVHHTNHPVRLSGLIADCSTVRHSADKCAQAGVPLLCDEYLRTNVPEALESVPRVLPTQQSYARKPICRPTASSMESCTSLIRQFC